MQNVTLAIAVIFSLLALVLSPAYALAAYITALLWYPYYLVITVGVLDISVGRIVVGVLFLRCLCDNRIRSKFAWSRLDTWVTLSMVVYIGVFCVTRSLSYAIENRSGFLMDTWFAYMVGRFIVTDRATIVSVIKCLSVVLIPLTILGMIEAKTGWQPFVPLIGFCPWHEAPTGVEVPRFGLMRAMGPSGDAILFGCGFAMLLPLIYYLHHEKGQWGRLAYFLSGSTVLGALTSMSNCPWVMVIIVICCLVMEKYRQWVKPLFLSFVFFCVFVGIGSNRPFYHVLASYGNPLGGASWHRARVIDLAIEHFDEWWFLGYKGRDPGWGSELGMGHTDVTNEFILTGVKYGVLGVIVLCVVLTIAFRGTIRAYKNSKDQKLSSLYWVLGSILFSVMVIWSAVSFFGSLTPLFYCTLGVVGSSFNFTAKIPERTNDHFIYQSPR